MARCKFKRHHGQCQCLLCGKAFHAGGDCKIDDAMRAALKAWQAEHGRTWKAKLNDAWQTGDYGLLGDQYSQPLQLMRNTIGPTQLLKIATRLIA